ncbi:MAG: hypothetical protein AB8E82_06245 [Aureispira sp.]
MNTDFRPHAELKWIEEANAIQVKWLQLHMSSKQFYKICAAAIKILMAHKGNIWIADMFDSEGVFSREIQQVITSTVLQQQADAAGIEYVFTVMPKTAGLSSLNTRTWLKKAQKMELQDSVVEFPNLETCLEWIKSH